MLYFPADFLLDDFCSFFLAGVNSCSSACRSRHRRVLISTNSRLNSCQRRYASISCSVLRRAAGETQGLGHRLAVLFVSQTKMGSVPGIVGTMAMTTGIATAPGGGGDRVRPELAQFGDFPQ